MENGPFGDCLLIFECRRCSIEPRVPTKHQPFLAGSGHHLVSLISCLMIFQNAPNIFPQVIYYGYESHRIWNKIHQQKILVGGSNPYMRKSNWIISADFGGEKKMSENTKHLGCLPIFYPRDRWITLKVNLTFKKIPAGRIQI